MRPLLEHLRIRNLLSFDPTGVELPMQPLNVLIGANGSGKSNVVEALALLKAAPMDVAAPVRAGGGIREWIWKGEGGPGFSSVQVVVSEAVTAHRKSQCPALRYGLAIGADGDTFKVIEERLEARDPHPILDVSTTYLRYDSGRPALLVGDGTMRVVDFADFNPTLSMLAQRKDPEAFAELTRLGDLFSRIRIYRNWSFGPGTGLFGLEPPLRGSCAADVPTDHLSERLDNLPARLAVLVRDRKVKASLLAALQEFSESFTDIIVAPEGGRLRLELAEQDRLVPSSRLSDGTLRFLALLTILLDPQPGPLTVIEEPELGMHPDMMPVLAKLLLDASARGQLVVTTHSEQLVSALSETPESVVVCEKHDGRTKLKRLDAAEVAPFLESYRLGDAWLRGMIGATRW